MTADFKYFAYGSNLHPSRLQERVGPVRSDGVAVLRGASLRFNKIGIDGSGKGNLTFEGGPNDLAIGVIYRLNGKQRESLDNWESFRCGYEVVDLAVNADGSRVAAFTYVAGPERASDRLVPFDWYLGLVALGAAYHGFPKFYMAKIERSDSAPDPDERRAARNGKLIAKMLQTDQRREGDGRSTPTLYHYS